MARMHSKGRGRSGSNRPYCSEVPDWSNTDKGAVEELILELHNKGHDSASIGLILRDRHAIPSVKMVLGERISQVISRNGLEQQFPDDLVHILRKIVRLDDHLLAHRKDLHNRRQLELAEAKARRLIRYLKFKGRIDTDFRYRRDSVRLLLS